MKGLAPPSEVTKRISQKRVQVPTCQLSRTTHNAPFNIFAPKINGLTPLSDVTKKFLQRPRECQPVIAQGLSGL